MPKTKASLCIIAVTIATVVVMFVLPITPKIPVSTATITRGNLIVTQALEGLVGYQHEQICVSPLAGQMAQVNVTGGQAVQKGQVLARLDTSLEEQALVEMEQALHQQKQATGSLVPGGEAIQAVWLQNQMSMEAKMRELQMSIEAKTIRAASDGVVGQVYVSGSAYVAAFSPLMNLHSQRLEICARQRAQESMQLQLGMRAVVSVGGEQWAAATLCAFDAPQLDVATGLYMQTLHFAVDQGEERLEGWNGKTVNLEVVENMQADVALAPVAAVSADNTLWLIREGQVTALKVDPQQRDADYVRVSEELVGEKVVLLPDEAKLHPGSLVKETKR